MHYCGGPKLEERPPARGPLPEGGRLAVKSIQRYSKKNKYFNEKGTMMMNRIRHPFPSGLWTLLVEPVGCVGCPAGQTKSYLPRSQSRGLAFRTNLFAYWLGFCPKSCRVSCTRLQHEHGSCPRGHCQITAESTTLAPCVNCWTSMTIPNIAIGIIAAIGFFRLFFGLFFRLTFARCWF